MNIEKLKKIVEKEDIKEFCEFFLGLEREEILKLSGKQYDEVMELCCKLKCNEKLAQVVEFLQFLYVEGGEALSNAIESRSALENALISRFYFDCFLSLSIKKNQDYDRALMNKGTSLRSLAEQGIETESNLKESLKCFAVSASTFKREKSDLDYALSLMSKGNSLRILAEKGIDTENNFKRAIISYVEAEDLFYEKSSPLMFVMTACNHCAALWWKYTETKEDKYLEDAIEIAKKARNESPLIAHPSKELLICLSFQVYDTFVDKHKASKKESYEEMHKKIDEVLACVNILGPVTIWGTKNLTEQSRNTGEESPVRDLRCC